MLCEKTGLALLSFRNNNILQSLIVVVVENTEELALPPTTNTTIGVFQVWLVVEYVTNTTYLTVSLLLVSERLSIYTDKEEEEQVSLVFGIAR